MIKRIRNRMSAGGLALTAAAVALASITVTSCSAPKPLALTADFADTTGLYVGNEVDYLGVPVGRITEVTPKGPVMTVHMNVEPGTQLPADAGAEILQSALLTDRYIQIGPAYGGGPTLASGAHIDATHTRSPISIDDLGRSLDRLMQAVDTTPQGANGIGDLVHGAALTLDGNGTKIHDLLVSSRQALATINGSGPDLQAIVANLQKITQLLSDRDATVRSLTGHLDQAASALASQSGTLNQTMAAVSGLADQVAQFVKSNGGAISQDLTNAAAVAKTLHAETPALASIFDLLPTGAENIVRAFDPATRSLRVELSMRDSGPFSSAMRAGWCQTLLGNACGTFFNAQGTGPLDVLFAAAIGSLPGSLG